MIKATSDLHFILTLPMLRLLSPKHTDAKVSENQSKPCHVDISWIAHAEYSQMSTQVPGL